MNMLLQRLIEVKEPHHEFPNFIEPNYACFHNKLETTLKSELDEKIFAPLVLETVDKYGLRKTKDALKNPVTMTEILLEANKRGTRSESLDQIIDNIFNIIQPAPAAIDAAP